MCEKLKVGDVIHIKKGMSIFASIEKKFKYVNRAYSNEKDCVVVKVGDILQIAGEQLDREALAETIRNNVFTDSGKTLSLDIISDFLKENIEDFDLSEKLDTSIFEDEYVVTSVEQVDDGDNYVPRINCEGLNNKEKIFFHHYGSFYCNINPSDVIPIKKMKRTFVEI